MFTITLSQAAVDRLQLILARYNVENGATLTLVDWMQLHLREVAIQDEWSQSAETIQRQSQTDVHAAILAERERLLGLV
ncbi:MAG: hypothetical protein ACRD1S_03155 [Vicinamibacterales bacterium]